MSFVLENHRQYADWKRHILAEILTKSSRAFLIATGVERHPDDAMLLRYQEAYESNKAVILAHRRTKKRHAKAQPKTEGAVQADTEDGSDVKNIDPVLLHGPFKSFGNAKAHCTPARNSAHDEIVTSFEHADRAAKRIIIKGLSEAIIQHVDARCQPTSHRLMQFLDEALAIRIDNARLRQLTTRLHTMRMNSNDKVEVYVELFNDALKQLDELDHLPDTAIQVNAFLLGLPTEWEGWRQVVFAQVDRHFGQGKADLTLLSSLQSRACMHALERTVNALTRQMQSNIDAAKLNTNPQCSQAQSWTEQVHS